MDYAIEIQRILDALKADQEPNKYWKNKVIGRLTELQPFCLMFYETPSFSDQMPYPVENEDGTITTVHPGQPGNNKLTIDAIPESLREFADPAQLQQPPIPEQPTV